MQHDHIEHLINDGGIIHLSGEPFSGKTRLGIHFAAKASQSGHVIWLCADGKTSFVEDLRKNITASQGVVSNLELIFPNGHEEIYESLMTIHSFLKDDTILVVIDPITRAIDLGRRYDDEMWGRELFEDVLPSLVGLAMGNELCIVFTSEVRMGEGGATRPVFHKKLTQWADVEIHAERAMTMTYSHLTLRRCNSEPADFGIMRIKNGLVTIDVSGQEVQDCSESSCSV